MSFKYVLPLLKDTYSKWSERQAPRLGASVAFYSILSFSPLLVLVTALIALVFGHESAQASLISEAREWIGDQGAETVQTLLKNAQQPASGLLASVLAFVVLLFGASGVFIELQDSLNLMWEVSQPSAAGLMGWIKQRVFSFGMILSVGFLLLVFLIVSAALAFVGHYFGAWAPLPSPVLQAINFVISFIAVAALFALMFKYVPAAKISWKDVAIGAVGTALLFSLGKLLLGLYLGRASVGSTYGAAGSLVAAVVWIYYSAQIFFFGAEFTRVYSDWRKLKTQPPLREPPLEASHQARAGN
jgi:membrane protein